MENTKFCSECGKTINSKAEICPHCGVRQMPAPGGRSRVAAALFAFFLGGIGIHKFYLGQAGWGFIYLVFCWTLIPGLVAFLEAILLLLMSDSEFNQKYNSQA